MKANQRSSASRSEIGRVEASHGDFIPDFDLAFLEQLQTLVRDKPEYHTAVMLRDCPACGLTIDNSVRDDWALGVVPMGDVLVLFLACSDCAEQERETLLQTVLDHGLPDEADIDGRVDLDSLRSQDGAR